MKHQLCIIFLGVFGYSLVFANQQDSTLLNQGIDLVSAGKDDEAEPLLIEALKAGNELTPLQKGIAHYYRLIIFRDRNDLDAALDEGKIAMQQFEAVDNHTWLGRTNYTLSMINLVLGDYDLSLLQTQKACDYFEKAKDTAYLVKSYARKGLVFHDIAAYEDGVKSCMEADEIHQQFSGKEADIQAIIWGIMAINYDDWGDYEEAINIYRKVLALKDELSSDREIIRTYNNMGNSLRKLGQLEEAKFYISKNLEANEQNGFEYGLATAKTNLGNIAYQQGNFNEAQNYLDEAERIAYRLNDVEKIQDVLEQKHLFYEAADQPEMALIYLKKFHSLKDSLYGLDQQRQIRLLETRFETQKKEQQIEIQDAQLAEQQAELQTNKVLLIASILISLLIIFLAILNRNRLRKKQELSLQKQRIQSKEAEIRATIASLEKERARYARDLHDGLGQMLSVLNRNLQNIGDAQPESNTDIVDQSEKLLDEMYVELRRICFDLMPQTLLSFGLKSAIQELAARINQTNQLQIETHFSGLENRLSKEAEISLYRISQEWLNNMLKYSDAKEVTLQITGDETELTLMIEDDGMGFDVALLEKSSGNGWRNIHSRLDLINGRLLLENSPNVRGNVLIIDFPRQTVNEEVISESSVVSSKVEN